MSSMRLFKYESRSSGGIQPKLVCNNFLAMVPSKNSFWGSVLQWGSKSVLRTSSANSRFFLAPVSLSILIGVKAAILTMCLSESSCVMYLLPSMIDACRQSRSSRCSRFKRMYSHISRSLVMPSARKSANNSIGCLKRGIVTYIP